MFMLQKLQHHLPVPFSSRLADISTTHSHYLELFFKVEQLTKHKISPKKLLSGCFSLENTSHPLITAEPLPEVILQY